MEWNIPRNFKFNYPKDFTKKRKEIITIFHKLSFQLLPDIVTMNKEVNTTTVYLNNGMSLSINVVEHFAISILDRLLAVGISYEKIMGYAIICFFMASQTSIYTGVPDHYQTITKEYYEFTDDIFNLFFHTAFERLEGITQYKTVYDVLLEKAHSLIPDELEIACRIAMAFVYKGYYQYFNIEWLGQSILTFVKQSQYNNPLTPWDNLCCHLWYYIHHPLRAHLLNDVFIHREFPTPTGTLSEAWANLDTSFVTISIIPSLYQQKICKRTHLLGKGTYGAAYKIVENENTTGVIKNYTNINSFYMTELNILALLRNHPHIIQLHCISNVKSFQIHMEYAECSLSEQVKKSLNTVERLELCKQLMDGVRYMHSKSVIHRDLHHGNIMIKEGKIKIIDFSLSMIGWKGIKYTYNPYICTIDYRPIECLLQDPTKTISCVPYGMAVDVWPAACILYYITHGRQLFYIDKEGTPLTEFTQLITTIKSILGNLPDYYKSFANYPFFNEVSFTINSTIVAPVYSVEFEALLRAMLCYIPDHRITSEDAYQQLLHMNN